MNFEEYIRFVRENMGYNYTYLQIVNLKETILKISILFVIVVSVLIIGFGKNNFKNKRNNEE